MTTYPNPLRRLNTAFSNLKERHLALLFVAPSVLLLTVLIGWSIIYSFWLSLNDLNVVGGVNSFTYVGLAHYLQFFSDSRLHMAIMQTLFYCFFMVTGTMFISMILALILNQSIGGVSLLKRFFLVPWALSYVVNALIWGWIYHGNYGALNAILVKLGLIKDYIVWLGDPGWAMAAIIFADIWKAVPFAALILLAALKGVHQELLEAAMIDGANAWARFWNVTLPHIRGVTVVLLVLQTTWALKAFDVIWVLTRGGPVDKTLVLNIFAYQQTFQFFNFGYGSAVGFLVLVLNVGLTIIYLSIIKGFDD
jgi:ABC-type sugar transport system permease subunit